MRKNLYSEPSPRKPLISIITVVLNGGETLERAIKSSFFKNFNDFEYIIIDGGSLDGSVGIIKRYESRLSFWVSEKDNGVYDAMNKAVAVAKGNWFYFLGADDCLLEGFAAAASHLKDERTLYYGDVYRPNLGRIYDGRFSAYKLACRNICHQSIFYPKCIWDKYFYDVKYPVFADYELNLRCFADVSIKFKYLPLTIAVFSDEGGLSQAGIDAAFEKDKVALIKKGFPSWVYGLTLIRVYLLNLLSKLRLEKIFVTIYHFYLKKRMVLKREKCLNKGENRRTG